MEEITYVEQLRRDAEAFLAWLTEQGLADQEWIDTSYKNDPEKDEIDDMIWSYIHKNMKNTRNPCVFDSSEPRCGVSVSLLRLCVKQGWEVACNARQGYVLAEAEAKPTVQYAETVRTILAMIGDAIISSSLLQKLIELYQEKKFSHLSIGSPHCAAIDRHQSYSGGYGAGMSYWSGILVVWHDQTRDSLECWRGHGGASDNFTLKVCGLGATIVEEGEDVVTVDVEIINGWGAVRHQQIQFKKTK